MRYSLKRRIPQLNFGLHTGRVNQTYKVRFDSSCLLSKCDGWSMLDGWSYDLLPVNDNSVRVAWRVSVDKIQLALCYRQDGLETIKLFTTIDVDKDYTLGIFYKIDDHDKDDNNIYNPRITLTCTRYQDQFYQVYTYLLPKPFTIKPSYKLFPYFHESITSPEDMFILSEEKR